MELGSGLLKPEETEGVAGGFHGGLEGGKKSGNCVVKS